MNLVIFVHSVILLELVVKTFSQEGILNGWDYKDSREADTKKDLVQPDEKHLEGIPKFLQQPQSVYYVSKISPATITCIAQPVSHVNIICADKQYSYMNEDISPSGLRVTKLDSSGRASKKGQRWKFSLEVKQKDVIEWFSEYRCYCEAWNQIELLQRVKKVESSYAIVYESYFNKDFKSPPTNQDIIAGGTLKLTCVAPDAKPSAEIHWLKNGKNLTSSQLHARVDVNVYGQLLIRNARVTDSGNYSCVATSQGMERVSTATVTVIEIGQWSDWMEWSGTCPLECLKRFSCPSECSSSTRQRIRLCKKIKDRQTHCNGLGMEIEKCDVHCDLNQWTIWSDWSKCSGSPCRSIRTRQCTTNSCIEPTSIDMKNCTLNECGGSVASFIVNEKAGESTPGFMNSHDIAMYVGLFVAVSVFLMVVVVIFCLIRRRVIGFSPNRVWRYTTTPNGIPMFYPDKNLKKNFSTMSNKEVNLLDINQPSLYRSMVLPNSLQFLSTNHSDISSNGGYADVGNEIAYIPSKQLPSLPLIATPLISSMHQASMIRPSYSDSKVSGLHQQIGLPRHVSTLPIPDSRPVSDHYQELGNTDSEMADPSIIESWLPDGFDGDNMVWTVMDSNGGRITLPHTDISLTCPPKALSTIQQEQVFLGICNNEPDIKLKENETLLSPIVVCGPAILLRSKPFILNFPHCAHSIDSKEWSLSILTSYSPLKQRPYWQKFLDIENEESSLPPGYAQVTKDKLYLLTNQLQRFCLIGCSRKNKDATKVFRIAGYCTGLDRRHSDEDIVIRLYLVPDVAEQLKKIHQFETNILGSRLVSNQKQFLCEDGAGNIVVSIAELSCDWQICSVKNYQEIPFQDLWHSTSLHCSFSFMKKITNSNSSELKVSLNSLDTNWFCNIYFHQPNSRHSKQNVIFTSLSTSPHTSLSATSTQFSSYSVNGGSPSFPYFVDDCNRNSADSPFKLPEEIKSKLCQLMDSPSPLNNDWKELARFLSINRCLHYFSNKPNPTEILLDLWEAQNPTRKSLKYLVALFRKIARLDCVAILEKELLQIDV